MTCVRGLLLLLLLLSAVLAQETTGEVPSPASSDTPAPTPTPSTDAPATTAPPPTVAPETPSPTPPPPSPQPTKTDAPAPTVSPTWAPAPPTQAPVTNPTPNPGNNVATPPPAVTVPPTVVIVPSTGSSSTTAVATTMPSPPKENNASRPANSTTSTETASGSNMDVIVGVLGGIIGTGVLALGVVCVLRRRQRKNVPARDSTFWPISPPPAMLEASPRKPSTFFQKHQSALASLDGSRSTTISDDILDSFAPNRRSSALFLREDFGRAKSVQIDVADSIRPSNILVGSVHIDDDDDFDGDVDAIRGHHQSYTL